MRRPSESRAAATASTVASRRRAAPRAARHRYREPHGFVPPVLDGDAAARPPPAVSAERVHSRTAQNEIRVVLGCGGGFLRVLDSRICEVIFVRGSGVKTLDDLDAGLWDLLLAAQMAALAAQGLQAQSGTFSRSIPQI